MDKYEDIYIYMYNQYNECIIVPYCSIVPGPLPYANPHFTLSMARLCHHQLRARGCGTPERGCLLELKIAVFCG